jgi:polyketide synthase PksJ
MARDQQNFNLTVIELFEHQSQKTPNLIAVQDKNITYSYKELNEKANQFAHWLVKKHINQNDFVAILLEPSVDFIICILAIIKIGAIYVPLDTKAPQTRLETITNDFNPKLIITSEKYKVRLKNNVNCGLIKNIQLECICCPKHNFNIAIDANSPIYLMYTSGSTGKPKGILIPHNAVVNLAKVDNYATIKKGTIIGQFSNLAFDASTFEIWSALLNGGVLSIIPISVRTDHIELKKYLQEQQITCLFLPTGYFHQLIKSFPKTLNSVEMIIFGGEQVNPILIRNFLTYRKINQLPITLVNGYGPTEATTFTCRHIMTEVSELEDAEFMSIGNPIKNVKTYVLDEHGNQTSEGELYISGINLALGYHNIKNKDQFSNNLFEHEEPYNRIYKTGDKVKLLPSGKLLCLGRLDDQVKIGGFRVHLNEIENELMKHEAISLAAVVVEIGGGAHKMLTAYLVLSSKEKLIHANEIRTFLSLHLPPYMLPSKYVLVDELPLTSVGKVDKKNLDKLPHIDLYFHIDTSSSSIIEESIKKIWGHLLNRSNIEVHKNLFDLGANSLLMLEACARINNELKTDLQITQILTHPTIYRLSRFIEGSIEVPIQQKLHEAKFSEIAIIGMSCRFPKANSVQEFWENLCQGKVCFERFTEKQLGQASNKLQYKNFVPVRGILSDIEQFDANFFGFSPMDASITDPQQRLFLECTWEALEQAAVIPSQIGHKISVFAGMADSTYLHENLLKNSWTQQELDRFQQRIATSLGMLSTQVSYRLNLKGQSLNINTACSTGLVAVAQACQELMMGTSDIALAGAISIAVPQIGGYIYKQGGIESASGYCRPFESRADGTVFSNGVGVVVLKRLEEALIDHDTIFAVIKGVGINNDGTDKLGYTAPSVNGQIACIRDALSRSRVRADELGYIEAHGTATSLGDVVEVEALSAVFREQTDKKQYCAIGSVKGNIGHTDVSAGMAGLIKTALCLFHKKIPPMAHFEKYNPHINFEESPFFINSQLIDWQKELSNRYAGVSSFGVGGTNVHVVLSEHIPIPSTKETNNGCLVVFSAKTETSLQKNVENFSNFLENHHTDSFNIADIAYTLQTGREGFQWRCFCVGRTKEEIINNLSLSNASYCDIGIYPSIIFMFPGQGMQYHKMASELMIEIPFFSSLVEHGICIAKSYLDVNLLEIINNPSDQRLNQTQYAQPTLFIIEYALAKLLIHYGIMPNAVIGHSLGEYVAACIAGIFSFEDAIALVCQRGFLMASMPTGKMLAIECTKEELPSYLNDTELALHNAVNYFVIAGKTNKINKLEKSLLKSEKPFYKLNVSHAFHSRTIEKIEQPFKDLFSNLTLSAPQIPIVSNVTGTWLSTREATDSDYWYTHLRQTVQFCKGIETLLENSHPLFIEVGPGQSLNGFLKQIAVSHKKKLINTYCLPVRHAQKEELNQFLTAIGIVWQHGIQINWSAFHENTLRGHVPLPTYAFQKQRYWIEPDLRNAREIDSKPQIYISTWSHQPAYIKPVLLSSTELTKSSWIIFNDNLGLSKQVVKLLKEKNIEPIVVTNQKKYSQEDSKDFKINLTNKDDYLKLFHTLKKKIKDPIVLHFSSYMESHNILPSAEEINGQLSSSFYSLLYLTQAYIEVVGNSTPLKIGIVTAGTQQILGVEKINPINATLTSSCRVIMQEHTKLKCRVFDLNPKEKPQNDINLLNKIIKSCLHDEWKEYSLSIPYRNGYQWYKTYTIANSQLKKINRLKDNGIYLLTGGLGGIALSCCEAITKTILNPNFILLSRRMLPIEAEWQTILKNPNHEFYKIIKRLLRLKELGATFVFYQVDISQFKLLNNVIQKCISHFGTINGLIHTAGISNPELIEFKSKMATQDVFLAKLYGTYNLIKSLKNSSLDFIVLTSSLAVLLGGYRQIDYCAANACLDAFAASDLFSFCSFVVSINWNTWRDVGIAAEAALRGEPTFLGKGNDISPQQGQELFLKILQGNETQVAISHSDINLVSIHDPIVTNTSSSTIKTTRQNTNMIAEYLPPSNEVESKLVQLWQDSLGIETIGVTDNFFNLGGHSLNAINLIEKINKNFNCSLPATQIYRDPTIRQLCSAILNSAENKLPNVPILLKKRENNPPYLFLCHPISGLINCFHAFASQSKLPMSIYGIQDPSIETNKMRYDSLLSMAEDYLLTIQKIQPVGPYFLIGYSFGGNIFFEIANKLAQQGQRVNLLALIDSWAINSPVLQSKPFFKEHLAKVNGLSNEIINLAWERKQLLLSHSLSTVNQEILLFKASILSDIYQAIDHPTNGWAQYNKGKIISHTINCDHDNFFSRQNSKNVLELIQEYLKDKYEIVNEDIAKCIN